MTSELFRRNLPNQFGFGVTGGLKLYGFGVGLLFVSGLVGLSVAAAIVLRASFPLRHITSSSSCRVCHIIVAVLS